MQNLRINNYNKSQTQTFTSRYDKRRIRTLSEIKLGKPVKRTFTTNDNPPSPFVKLAKGIKAFINNNFKYYE